MNDSYSFSCVFFFLKRLWKFRKSLFRNRSRSRSGSGSKETPSLKSNNALLISDPNLQKKFVVASGKVRGGDPKLQAIQKDEQMQLRVYGLFKQASEGPAPENSANFWDYVAKAKWNAWNGLRTLSREEAMQQYVQLIEDVSGEKILISANGETPTTTTSTSTPTTQWKSQSKTQDPLGSFAVKEEANTANGEMKVKKEEGG